MFAVAGLAALTNISALGEKLQFEDLTDKEHYLIRQANIEKPNFTEATPLTKTFGCGLNRFIPPSLVLALAQTDKDEKPFGV